MKENINELLEEINDQELESEVVGGMILNECDLIQGKSGRTPSVEHCVKD